MQHLLHRITPFLLLLMLGPAAFAQVPELEFHYAEEFAALAEKLEHFDEAAYQRTVDLVGLDEPGPPIPVYLVREGSGAARRAPSWGVAYATGRQIVLIPSRVPGYPNRTIETVLHHEVAHILIERASEGRGVPRWFHEGIALYTARDWNLEDRSRILWATLRGDASALARLERSFHAGANSAARAYAFSGAFMRFLIGRYGTDAPADILARVAEGASFAESFRHATGASLGEAEAGFFRHLDFWNKWVPVLTSSTTLWALISMLALVAFKRRRDRDEKIRAQWDAEDAAVQEREARSTITGGLHDYAVRLRPRRRAAM